MDDNFGIGDGHNIDFAIGELRLENRPFLDHNIDLQLICWDVLKNKETTFILDLNEIALRN